MPGHGATLLVAGRGLHPKSGCWRRVEVKGSRWSWGVVAGTCPCSPPGAVVARLPACHDGIWELTVVCCGVIKAPGRAPEM